MTQIVLQAGELNPGPAPSLRLPKIFRPGRVRFDSSVDPSTEQESSVFDLRASISSHGDVVEVQPSPLDGLLSDDDSDDDFENRRGIVRIQHSQMPPDEQLESVYPPQPLDTRIFSTEPIPLDGALRDDVPPDEEDSVPSRQGDYAAFDWIAGSKNQLGMMELDFKPSSRVWFDATQPDHFYLGTEWGARWLNGPDVTDLPPYLFNILINVGPRFTIDDRLTIDAMISPGWFTDFSNKGHQDFRLPWHVVSYYHLQGDWHLVGGVTDLARDDIHYLPVVGTAYTPVDGDVRLDLIFPKPRVAWRIDDGSPAGQKWSFGDSCISIHQPQARWLTLGGELGGGSWSISRADHSYDVVTYRDYRLVAGLENTWPDGGASRLEIGWVFNRAVQYRSGIGNYNPPDSLMIRISTDY